MKSFNRKVRRAGAKNRKVNFISISLNPGDCFVGRRSLPSRNCEARSDEATPSVCTDTAKLGPRTLKHLPL